MMRKQTEVFRGKKQPYNLAVVLFSLSISIVLHTELLSFDFKLMHLFCLITVTIAGTSHNHGTMSVLNVLFESRYRICIHQSLLEYVFNLPIIYFISQKWIIYH